MAFKLNLSKTIKSPVDLIFINEDGKPQKHIIHFEFLRVPRHELDSVKAPKVEPNLTSEEYLEIDVDWLRTFVKDWGNDVEVTGGKEFNRENFRELISYLPGSASNIYAKFIEVNAGASAKN